MHTGICIFIKYLFYCDIICVRWPINLNYLGGYGASGIPVMVSSTVVAKYQHKGQHILIIKMCITQLHAGLQTSLHTHIHTHTYMQARLDKVQ